MVGTASFDLYALSFLHSQSVVHSTGFNPSSFYFVNDRVTKVRTFNDHRLNFVPCSLYLALEFARDVLDHELSGKASKLQSGIDDDFADTITEDEEVQTLLRILLEDKSLKPMRVSSELARQGKAIGEAVRAGKPLPLSAELMAHGDFIEGLRTRVQELQKEKLAKIYSVAIAEHNLNNLNPYSLRKVGMKKDDVTRENYRLSNLSDKQCAIFNSAALEGFNFLSTEDFFAKVGNPTKKRKAPLEYRDLFSRLSDHGSTGYMVYNFDVKLGPSTLTQSQE